MRNRCCCNCRHNIRRGETHVSCYCDIDWHYIDFFECFYGWCKHWAREKKMDEVTK